MRELDLFEIEMVAGGDGEGPSGPGEDAPSGEPDLGSGRYDPPIPPHCGNNPDPTWGECFP